MEQIVEPKHKYIRIIILIIILIFSMWCIGLFVYLTRDESLSTSIHILWVYGIELIFLYGVFLVSSLIFLALCQSTGITTDGRMLRVSYVYFADRRFAPKYQPIRKHRVRAWNSANTDFEYVWLLRFGGWRFAVVPIDWEMPTELTGSPDN